MDGPGVPRRRFLGYVLAAPTLVAGAQLGIESVRRKASAAYPSVVPSSFYDLSDLLNHAAQPTAHLITVVIGTDGTASFELPRTEVGQGITTAVAMVIADELDLPIDKVRISLADARPELVWNQITGGSNTMHSIYTPVRVASAVARQRLLDAAAHLLGVPVPGLTIRDGVVVAPDGRTAAFGDLAERAAASTTTPVRVRLKTAAEQRVVGTPRSRVDGRAIVTGAKRFTTDLDVPGALPTMLCRAPTINGSPAEVRNRAAVLAMPGVTDVVAVPTGVAVRARTFGQCIDAVNALRVRWAPGTAEGKSDASVLEQLRAAELPMALPDTPLATVLDRTFTFAFAGNSALETCSAIADVRDDRAEIWSSVKNPIVTAQRVASALGLPQSAVTVHVVDGGGSFGRRLFSDGALEAATVSKAMGKPVKLMWHRTDDVRQGRMHPMCTSHVRAAYTGRDVVAFAQRHTSISTDWSHGLGEILSATLAEPELGNLGYSHAVFQLTQIVPYGLGVIDQQINEVDTGFNTGSMRHIYSPNVTAARELVLDELARAMKEDPYALRRRLLQDARSLAVLDAVAKAGRWGRRMPPGTAQGIAVHSEYKSRAAVLAEIDCTPATLARRVPGGYTGPRVTKIVVAIDAGLPVNPRGLEAQMMGGAMDGIALALTYSVHLRDGHALEGSWDNAFYTRQWNVPPELQVIVMPPTTGVPGGAGELGVGPSFAAVACAYARATGKLPTTFPINHDRADLGFAPIPQEPPLPPPPSYDPHRRPAAGPLRGGSR